MGTEVEKVESVAIGDIPKRGAAIMEHLGITLSDPAEIQWRIVEQLAFAGSLDELLAEGNDLGLRDHYGEPFMIRSVEYLPSSYVGGAGLFAVIDAVDRDGLPIVRTTGALSVVIQIARGVREGWWDGVYVKAKPADRATADGNIPYRLVRA